MNTMEYKGYLGSAEVDTEADVLVGKLLFIKDTITFSATSPAGLQNAFREAVDEYLDTCKELGDEPDQPCKGSFNIRVGPVRHLALALEARKRGVTLNELVCQSLDAALMGRQHTAHNHIDQIKVQLQPADGLVVTSTASTTNGSFSRATSH
jgi:predicted HicB family RNase H-like nuclease